MLKGPDQRLGAAIAVGHALLLLVLSVWLLVPVRARGDADCLTPLNTQPFVPWIAAAVPDPFWALAGCIVLALVGLAVVLSFLGGHLLGWL